jgi:hypothetical protein
MIVGSPHNLSALDPVLQGLLIVFGNSRSGFDQVQFRSDNDQDASREMALKLLPSDLSRFLRKFSTQFGIVHSWPYWEN